MDKTHYKVLKYLKSNPSAEPDVNEIGAQIGRNPLKTGEILEGMIFGRLIKRAHSAEGKEIWRIDDFGSNLLADETSRHRFPFFIAGVAFIAALAGFIIGAMFGPGPSPTAVIEVLKKKELQNYVTKNEFKNLTKEYPTKNQVKSFVSKQMDAAKKSKKKAARRSKSSRKRRRR